jgi:hypothetical protein
MERSPAASSSGSPAAASTCLSCGAIASGKFCSNCGATLASADCAACGAPLRPGAKFCHRCGTAAGAAAAAAPEQRSFSAALPWGVAAIALVALIALLAGQHFGGGGPPTPAAQPGGGPVAGPFAGATGNGPAPDISNLTADQAAARLYDRIMMAYESGHADTVQMFAPMAITAYQMIDTLDLDERYDLGRIALVSGQEPLARAEADTILSKNPTHLLGLILATQAAETRKDKAAAKKYHAQLIANVASERAKRLPEYTTHDNDISAALDSKNAP